MKRGKLLTWGIIIAVIIFALIIINLPKEETPIETVKCIGKRTTLYTQLGCHACETQEKIFGENYQYLNSVDCFFEREKCEGITATPTWKIGEKIIVGIQSLDELKKLTGC
jgi:hypothetical protein